MQDRFLSDIAVSEAIDIEEPNKMFAVGDEIGQIQVWRIHDVHNNIPCAMFRYDAQVFDIKLV